MPLSEAAELIVKPGQFLKDGEQESVKFSTFFTGGISRKVRDNQNRVKWGNGAYFTDCFKSRIP